MSAADPKQTSYQLNDAHHRAVLDDVKSVLAEPAVLAEIDGKRAITYDRTLSANSCR